MVFKRIGQRCDEKQKSGSHALAVSGCVFHWQIGPLRWTFLTPFTECLTHGHLFGAFRNSLLYRSRIPKLWKNSACKILNICDSFKARMVAFDSEKKDRTGYVGHCNQEQVSYQMVEWIKTEREMFVLCTYEQLVCECQLFFLMGRICNLKIRRKYMIYIWEKTSYMFNTRGLCSHYRGCYGEW